MYDTVAKRESLLVGHRATDYGPMWTPNGEQIVFFSDRSGSVGLYLLDMKDGRKTGGPKFALNDLNRWVPMGFTADGSLYCHFRAGHSHMYEAVTNPDSVNRNVSSEKNVPEF